MRPNAAASRTTNLPRPDPMALPSRSQLCSLGTGDLEANSDVACREGSSDPAAREPCGLEVGVQALPQRSFHRLIRTRPCGVHQSSLRRRSFDGSVAALPGAKDATASESGTPTRSAAWDPFQAGSER